MADCGCRITGLVTTPDGQNHHMIEYCSLHKAAPELYEALLAIKERCILEDIPLPDDIVIQAAKALAKVG